MSSVKSPDEMNRQRELALVESAWKRIRDCLEEERQRIYEESKNYPRQIPASDMPTSAEPSKRECTLLLFLATPAEEEALQQAVQGRKLPFEKIKDAKLGEYHWLGIVGNETVIAVRPSREGGRLVMGALGRLGS